MLLSLNPSLPPPSDDDEEPDTCDSQPRMNLKDWDPVSLSMTNTKYGKKHKMTHEIMRSVN